MAEKTTNDAPTEVRIGLHIFRWEPPDIGYVAYDGDLDGSAMTEFNREARKFTVGKSIVFMIVNMAKAGRISSEARKFAAEGGKGVNFRGIAVVGAPHAIRIVTGLVARAVDLMNRNTDNPTRFFETEAQARVWIAERKRVVTLAT